MSDPTLSDGRLMLKVAAFNRTKVPAGFGPEDVKVFTASGHPVDVMTLDQLVQEAKGGGAPQDRGAATSFTAGNYSGPTMTHDRMGRTDLGSGSGFTGGAGLGGITSSGSRPTDKNKAQNDAKVQQQIASLHAAILQQMTI
jgi:hypothetical protein